MYNNPDTRHQTPDIIKCIKYVYRFIVPAFVRTEILRFRNYEYYKKIKRIKYIKKEIIAYLEAECAQSDDTEKKDILDCLKQRKTGSIVFPYKFTEKYTSETISVYTDSQCRLKYVLYEGKKLYFPKRLSVKNIQRYYNGLLIEQDSDSPHCYAGEGLYVEEGDVIADVGCAEAIWALSNVERASKVYLFECEEKWMEPLRKTFEPWKEKVYIINKYISNKSEGICITLDDFLKGGPLNVIKADIEGAELDLLEGAKNTLKRGNIKLLICTYHRQNDAYDIEKMLSENEYTLEFSKGYMLFIADIDLAPPYLRKVLIRAKKSLC